ncbi:hypothetical protein ACFXKY_28305 [Streptomyces canus]|uniref:hypothetical protein n=1 Tax=Streptomyces canus TaxID=58343 RepID=UPI00369E9A23
MSRTLPEGRVAVAADRLGYREVWAGEGPTWDSFVLATSTRTGHRPGRADRWAGPGQRARPVHHGPRAIAMAAAHADRMLLDVVSPQQVRALRAELDAVARVAGRTPPSPALRPA